MKKKWKIIFGGLVLLAMIGFVLTQILGGLEVEVYQVKAGDLARGFTEEGEVVATQERTLYSLHNAQIQRLLVEEGDRVNQGELVAVLDDRELRNRLDDLNSSLTQLEVEIEQAGDNVRVAERGYERASLLFQEGSIPEIELEEAQNLLGRAQRSVEGLKAQRQAILSQIEFIRSQMEDFRIYAPIGGIITNLQVEEKGLASPQTPLMTILYGEGHRIETRVLTRDIYDIYQGMPVRLTLKLRDEDVGFSGEVREILPYAEKTLSPLGLEEERVRVTIAPEVPEGLQIAPGYKVDVEFITDRLEDVIAVPKTSLFTYRGEDAVFVLENGQARIRRVETGLETRRDVLITEGLQVGELVILDPQVAGLNEGSRVTYSIEEE